MSADIIYPRYFNLIARRKETMKFLCNTEFFHSGVRLYTAGTVYNDITPKAAEQLIALDKKKPIGALSFFTPVDEEAVNYINGKKGKQTGTPDPKGAKTPNPNTKKELTRAELIQEAKDLGIQGTTFMKEGQLKEVIAAAKQNAPPDPKGTGAKTPDLNATPQV